MHILILSVLLFFGQVAFADFVCEYTRDHTTIEHIDDDAVTVVPSLGNATFGLFTIEFEIDPIGSDLYLRDRVFRENIGEPGVSFAIHDHSGIISDHNGFTVAAISSDWLVGYDNGYFVLPEGEFLEFELIVAYQPAITGFYKLVLQSATLFNEDGDMITVDVSGDNIDTRYTHLIGDPSLAAVPLPSGIWLMMSGFIPLVWKRRFA